MEDFDEGITNKRDDVGHQQILMRSNYQKWGIEPSKSGDLPDLPHNEKIMT